MLSSEAIILTPRSLKQQFTENFSLQCLDMFFCCMKSCRCSLYICLFPYPWLKCTWPWNSHYMFTMCKHLALIYLCSRWLVGDIWPSQVTPSPEWNMLCTDFIEYNPNISKRKKNICLSQLYHQNPADIIFRCKDMAVLGPKPGILFYAYQNTVLCHCNADGTNSLPEPMLTT